MEDEPPPLPPGHWPPEVPQSGDAPDLRSEGSTEEPLKPKEVRRGTPLVSAGGAWAASEAKHNGDTASASGDGDGARASGDRDGVGCGIALRRRLAAAVAAVAATAAAAARKRPAAAPAADKDLTDKEFWALSNAQRGQVRARLMRMDLELDPEESQSTGSPDRSSWQGGVTL